jgi:hypothetical protein
MTTATSNEVRALVRRLKGIASVPSEAGPEDKRAIDDELGANFECDPEPRTVRVGAGSACAQRYRAAAFDSGRCHIEGPVDVRPKTMNWSAVLTRRRGS